MAIQPYQKALVERVENGLMILGPERVLAGMPAFKSYCGPHEHDAKSRFSGCFLDVIAHSNHLQSNKPWYKLIEDIVSKAKDDLDERQKRRDCIFAVAQMFDHNREDFKKMCIDYLNRNGVEYNDNV